MFVYTLSSIILLLYQSSDQTHKNEIILYAVYLSVIHIFNLNQNDYFKTDIFAIR